MFLEYDDFLRVFKVLLIDAGEPFVPGGSVILVLGFRGQYRVGSDSGVMLIYVVLALHLFIVNRDSDEFRSFMSFTSLAHLSECCSLQVIRLL